MPSLELPVCTSKSKNNAVTEPDGLRRGAGPTSEAAIDADTFNAFEAAGWDQKAGGYDWFFGGLTSRLFEPLLDGAGVGPGTRLLDVATGPGRAAARAAERGASVVGVDIAPGMVELARHMFPDLDFREAQAESLPFEDGSFDAVVGNFAVLHFGRPERAVAEFVRLLRPGGQMALTVWDRPDRARLVGVFVDAVAEVGARPPAHVPEGPPFFRFAAEDELTALLSDRGLSDVSVRTIAFEHPVSSADELWDGVLAATVRTSALILGQPDDTRRRIRAAFDRMVTPYRRGDHLELPVSAKLAVGRKAG
jgi:SAM-dependent methyltransferase